MTNLVGFAGFAGSGKDTASRCLIERGYTRLAFADAIKEVAEKCNPGIDVDYSDDYRDRAGYLYRVSDAVEANDGSECVWDYLKHIPAAREFLQNLGQSIRELDEDFWVRQFERRISDFYKKLIPFEEFKVVVTDVRYPNEAKFLKSRGWPYGPCIRGLSLAKLIWVERPGVGPCNGHESENPAIRDMCDVVVVNDGTVEELWEKFLGEVTCRGEEKIEG